MRVLGSVSGTCERRRETIINIDEAETRQKHSIVLPRAASTDARGAGNTHDGKQSELNKAHQPTERYLANGLREPDSGFSTYLTQIAFSGGPDCHAEPLPGMFTSESAKR